MASSFMKKLESLQKVIEHLDNVHIQNEIPDEYWIPTVITYFKLSFELSWKTMKRYMQDKSIEAAATGSPRDILKLAYAEKYILNEDLWLYMLEDINTIEHQYSDEIARDILDRICTTYLVELKRVCAYLAALPTDVF